MPDSLGDSMIDKLAPAGPVELTGDSVAVQRPVPPVIITGGLWHERQRINREASIPLGIGKLAEAGNFDDLRLAAGERLDVAYRGPVYMDTDVYKMLESVAYELGAGAGDEALATFLTEAIGLITRAQTDDGYLNSYYQVNAPDQRYAKLENSHELYTAGHLFQAAVALARAGDDRLLPIARRLADHLVRVFLDERKPRLDGHPEAETALVELYRLTGIESYLDLARRLIDDRGRGLVGHSPVGSAYFQDALPVREMPILTGHAVRAMYLEAGIVDVYLETGDRSLLDGSITRWEDAVATKTAITGGHGARQLKEAFGEGYELPSDQAYNETCAAVASIHWSWRLLLATGEARFADLIERTLYNVFAASVSLDGLEFFKGNPLQRRHDHEQVIGDPRYRGGWFWSACCPPNVTRLMSSLGHYVATTDAETLYLQQYTEGVVHGSVAGGELAATLRTDLPWSGRVMITIDRVPDGPCGLALRLPSWSERTELFVNDGPVPVQPDDRGYLVLRRAWRAGDTIRLELDLSPRLITPHPKIDAVRGSVAFERGPLVYCFEQLDQPEGVELERLRLAPEPELQVRPVDDHPGIGRTVLLDVSADVLADLPDTGLPYFRTPPAPTPRPVTATAIPYFQWSNRDRRAMRVWLPTC
ncbi:glycoside hydrolase family 127 protein [Microlunatus speluncae]|uniref:glycoside hydrolase family 127 protein n=1 Tax=Microlunatus speluncae TaxID=2594267 RepID=UPI001FEA3CE3|nr:beta-L-arabinofuranosidase domain-containing protein [Microlunatus speluncae]